MLKQRAPSATIWNGADAFVREGLAFACSGCTTGQTTPSNSQAGVVTDTLAQVAFPIFSAAGDDVPQLLWGVRLALRGIMLVNAPVMLGLAALAHALILTLFGEPWLGAAPIMPVLCLAGLLWPLHVVNLNVLLAQGHSRDLASMASVAATMALATYWIGTHLQLAPAMTLAVLVSAGALICLALIWGWRLEAFHEVLDVTKNRSSSGASTGIPVWTCCVRVSAGAVPVGSTPDRVHSHRIARLASRSRLARVRRGCLGGD